MYENAGAIKVVCRLKFVDALRKSLRFAERESYGTIQYMLTVARFVVMVKTLAVFFIFRAKFNRYVLWLTCAWNGSPNRVSRGKFH